MDVWDRREGGRVYAYKPPSSKYIYAKHKINGINKPFHHQILPKIYGSEVDHIEHPTMSFIDNRRSNLRAVTHSQNNMNRATPSNNRSGVVGVLWNKKAGKWHARIMVSGKYKHLGSFDNIDFAIGARQQAEREIFGEYSFKG